MGLFDFGKKTEVTDGIKLREKTFEAVLKTKSLAVTQARVAFVIDVSGSMQDEFSNGTVQKTVERMMPLALKFDDNGEMETFRFSGRCESCSNVGLGNIVDFVNKNIVPKAEWNGTEYCPVIAKIFDYYVEQNLSKIPTFVIFVTDGDNSDRSDTTKYMKEISKYNIFFKFIGIGTAGMSYLEQLDTMSGRKIDNANFQRIKDINKTSDEDLYKALLEEYDIWQNAAKQVGIL
ncbi:MAG: VWA domain-containing protein [Candidatus Omnitrophica bacterium]|jgi:hypothetical protein|nr:VWA domain-containing protein [Candidatus Omnitrophota bacterium]